MVGIIIAGFLEVFTAFDKIFKDDNCVDVTKQ